MAQFICADCGKPARFELTLDEDDDDYSHVLALAAWISDGIHYSTDGDGNKAFHVIQLSKQMMKSRYGLEQAGEHDHEHGHEHSERYKKKSAEEGEGGEEPTGYH